MLFIEKQASPNALPEMNKNSTPTPSCYADTAWAVHKHIQNRGASCSFILLVEIGDFVFQDESQKTLSILLCLPNHFHGKAPQRYVFLPEHDALFKEFFYLYVQFTSKNTINLLSNRRKHLDLSVCEPISTNMQLH